MRKNVMISPASLKADRPGYVFTAKGYVKAEDYASAIKAERESLKLLKGDA